MKRSIACLAAIIFCAAGSTVYALYSVSNEGRWPANWPKELEPLRKQARTLVGPTFEQPHYAIRFNKREEFESAWPHFLEVKTKGAPVFLVRGPNFFLGDATKPGVVIHCPLVGQKEAEIPGVENPRVRWMNTNYIELVVDGNIVDLNRIALPADTPIIDERFKDARGKKDAASK